jgi:hypothetical protein
MEVMKFVLILIRSSLDRGIICDEDRQERIQDNKRGAEAGDPDYNQERPEYEDWRHDEHEEHGRCGSDKAECQ